MLFKIQKPWLAPRLFYFRQHFSTAEAILQQTQKRMLYFLNHNFAEMLLLIIGTVSQVSNVAFGPLVLSMLSFAYIFYGDTYLSVTYLR